MSVYDEYGDVQLKVGDVCCRMFTIGDEVDISDGVYCGHEGFIVIKDGIFIAEYAYIYTKWGDYIYPETILSPHDPFLQLVKSFDYPE